MVIFWPLMVTEVFAGGLRGGGCAGFKPPGGSSAMDTPAGGLPIWEKATPAASTKTAGIRKDLIRLTFWNCATSVAATPGLAPMPCQFSHGTRRNDTLPGSRALRNRLQ